MKAVGKDFEMGERAKYRVEEMIGSIPTFGPNARIRAAFAITCIYFAIVVLQRKFGEKLDCTLEEMLEVLPLSGVSLDLIRSCLEDRWEKVLAIVDCCSPREWRDFFLDTTRTAFGDPIPSDWWMIISEILSLSDGDVFGLWSCDEGHLLANLLKKSSADILIMASHTDKELLALLEMRMYVLQPLRTIELSSSSIYDSNEFLGLLTKSFWGDRFRSRQAGEMSYMKSIGIPVVIPTAWGDILRSLDFLKEGGLSVVLFPDKGLSTSRDRSVRRYLVEKHTLEMVISMPNVKTSTSFLNTIFNSQEFSLLVFRVQAPVVESHQVMMVNARNLSPEKIVQALSCWKMSGELKDLGGKVYKVPLTTIFEEENESRLDCLQYQATPPELLKGRQFQRLNELATVRRGTINLANLKSYITDVKPTGDYVRYATLGDISTNGVISPSQYIPLSRITMRDKQNLLSTKDADVVILTRVGRPIKYAVLNLEKDEELLIGPNLYAIECKREVLDPYYFLLFLESPLGQMEFERIISPGATMASISMTTLKMLKVSCPPIERQRALVAEYKKTLSEVKKLQTKLDACRQKLKELAETL